MADFEKWSSIQSYPAGTLEAGPGAKTHGAIGQARAVMLSTDDSEMAAIANEINMESFSYNVVRLSMEKALSRLASVITEESLK